jgi:acetoin:2,6-dichlorophenolindophenol oxidoreductase subunit beta
VLTPSTPADAKGLLKTAIRNDNPVVFMPHKGLSNMTGEVPEGEHLVPLGQAEIRRQGRDLTIVAWSIMVGKSLAAAEQLAQEGIDAEVIDARGIRPFDFETVIASVRRTGRLLLAHESPVVGGPGAEVAAVIAERALNSLEAPIRRVGAPDIPMPQSQYLERLTVPQVDGVIRVAREMVDVSVAA